MSRGDWVPSHLFMAAPQVFANYKTLRRLRDWNIISQENYENLRSGSKSIEHITGDAKSGLNILRRVLAIEPGYLDEDFINLLRLGNLITKPQAHTARLMFRSQNALRGRRSDQTILTRYKRLFGVAYSEETINLMRSTKFINQYQSDAFRFFILSSKVSVETLADLRYANNLTHMFGLLGRAWLDPRTIRAMKYAGWLQPARAEFLEAAILMTRADWRVFHDAKNFDNFAQRMLYAMSGSFNHETVRFIRAAGLISRRDEILLRTAVQIGLLYQRRLQEKWTHRRYRPRAGEAPIKTFALASKKTDAELLRLLAKAANDAKKTANKLEITKTGVGGKVRAAQLRSVTAELHNQMQELWEGNGYLTIFGQHEAAQAALESQEWLQRSLLGKMTKEQSFMLAYNSRKNVDQYISRQENVIGLSRRVYKNRYLYSGKVDKAINLALLQGKSASELAKDVERFINPSVPGGVQYAARRLARTELQNAFHTTTIRYSREMPWVQAYQWHLSGSHKASGNDACEGYANDDHGLGVAGQFRKSQVPGKPHPNCFCYLTVVDVGEDEFFRLYKLGYYNRYLRENAMTTPDGQNSFIHDGIQSIFTQVGG